MIEWKSYSVPVSLPTAPLPGHLAALDRRHRWLYRSTSKSGDFWYRCTVCHKRKSVKPVVNLVAKKMRDARHAMEEQLSEVLWA